MSNGRQNVLASTSGQAELDEEERQLQDGIRLSKTDHDGTNSATKGSAATKRAADKEIGRGGIKRFRTVSTTSGLSDVSMAFPNGALRITRTPGRSRAKNCINLADVIHKDSLVSACIFSFFIANEELFEHLPLSHTSNAVPIYIGRDANMDPMVPDACTQSGIAFREKISKKQLQDIRPKLEQLHRRAYGNSYHAFYAWSSGSSHSKILTLVYPEFLRIAITSCNMMDIDTELGDNHFYIHDLPKLASRQDQLSTFESDLLAHLKALGTPIEFINSIQGKYDYSTVQVHLVTSVPGTYSGAKAQDCGLLRLREIIRSLDLNLAQKKRQGKLQLEVCAASLGNLSARWLDGFFDCALGRKYVEITQDCDVPSDLKLFYPTVEDVRSTDEEAQHGASNIGCHIRPWKESPKAIKDIFHHYHSKDSGKLFHQKLILAYNHTSPTSLPYYVYIGSANLSSSAWGALEKDKKENKATCDLKLIKTSNFECGVVVPGDLIESILEPGTKSWQDGIVPYDQAASKYDIGKDKPWNDPRTVVVALSVLAANLLAPVVAYTSLSDDSLHRIPAGGADFDIHNDAGLLAPILIPRVPDTPGSEKVQQHFADFFENNLPGWAVEWHNSTSKTPATGNKLVSFRNLIVRRDPPWAAVGDVARLTLAAHYDSLYRPEGFIGATDSAAPCAMLLHVARSVDEALTKKWEAMQSAGDTDGLEEEKGVQILLLDGEEAWVQWTDTDSTYGSRALASHWDSEVHPAMSAFKRPIESISLFVLLDLLGASDPHVPSYFPTTHWAYQNLAKIENRMRQLKLLESKPKGRFLPEHDKKPWQFHPGFVQDDHVPFMDRGVDILHLIPTPFPSSWHKMDDDGEHLDGPAVQDWAKLITAFVAEWMDLEGFMPSLKEESVDDRLPKPEGATTLPRVLLGCLLKPFLTAIVPRISVVVFRFAQPILMSRAIRFVTHVSAANDGSEGYWIVVGATAVYIGLAVSISVYQHSLNRLELMIRGTMTSLLHSRALEVRNSEFEDGKVATLVSNDISNLENSARMFHETWAQFAEVVIGTFLLSRQVGWLWPLPLVIIFFCSRVSRYVARNLKPKQGKWNTATQQRISFTNSMLGSIKNIKMLGMQQAVVNHIRDLRKNEMDAAREVRFLMVQYGASANALGLFAPVITLVLYAALAMLRGEALDAETAFTSVALLLMITHPANMIMTFIPRAVISYSGFERIQSYLLDKGGRDRPLEPPKLSSTEITTTPLTHAIELADVAIPGTDESKPILKDISFGVRQGSFVICTGPVGSGKTTLARAILGEVSPSKGIIKVSQKRLAYCSQTPWLPSQVIRDVIRGPTGPYEADEAWYQRAVEACCLDSDFKTLPDGDLTPVGSKGMNLSGGQRQRIALARAVYSRCEIIILDDSVSALDEKTQRHVVENLLMPGGILREHATTVLWITTTTKFFNLADEIIVLAGGIVKERGTWAHLRESDPLVDEIIHPHDETLVTVAEAQTMKQANLARKEIANDGLKDLARKNGDLSLYKYYLESARLRNIASLVMAAVFYSCFYTSSQYWIKQWTESGLAHAIFYMVGYVIFLVIAYVSTVTGMFVTNLRIAPSSGLALHNRLLIAIVSAPLLYFSGTDSGTILNRFGQDIQLVDKQLAVAFQSLVNQICKLLFQAIVLLLSQPLMALSLPYSAMVVYIVQKVYLRTSRQLRLLELEARAAVFSSFLETVQGAPTIRAFNWQGEFAEQNIVTLDGSQRPFYLLLCLQRWLNVVLNLLIAAIAVGTIWLGAFYRDSTTGGQIGMALNVILVANTTLLSLVEAWTDLEISLGAVARLKEAETETPREDQPGECDVPPTTWPSRGEIVLSGVAAAYNPSVLALKSLDLKIEAGQMVAVCGRTGSGKSSLLLTLLRLLDTTEGSIKIDGVELSSLPRSLVREAAFVTVAQEAFFLPQASLRFNLDPELKAPQFVIRAALIQTGLWDLFVEEQPGNHEEALLGGEQDDEGGRKVLDKPFSSFPALSAGQTQLFALSRALVRRSILSGPATSAAHYSDLDRVGSKPIVLLDEVTSSLDPVTEGKMLDIIREEFVDQGHTVVMVTHKLDAVRGRMREGRDAVVWMGQGRVERVEVTEGQMGQRG
ncbi:hypothetical protein N8I77_012799 [Diaporthe amygdali]|uniref:Peptide hydrolase n=1 Tax=Phomopsis amygdali TaxID=1214568 RepID=A0AAD9VZ30_PHOAM|nr:hypothetical protein N8I77_012799 [Diaporthe amygdali]